MYNSPSNTYLIILLLETYHIARKFRRVKFLQFFTDLSPPTKILIRETIFTSLIMPIGSKSAKIKSQKLSRMSFRENFTPRNFLAIRYTHPLSVLHWAIPFNKGIPPPPQPLDDFSVSVPGV